MAITEKYFIRNGWTKIVQMDTNDSGKSELFRFYALKFGEAVQPMYSCDNIDAKRFGYWFVTLEMSGFEGLHLTNEKKINGVIRALKQLTE